MSGGSGLPRLRIGQVPLDRAGLEEVRGSIAELVASGRGGRILLPGLEQIVLAEHHAGLREALVTADLSLAGGRELARAARVLGRPLPESPVGARWLPPLAQLAHERGWRVFVVSDQPGVAERIACVLRDEHGVLAVGTSAPRLPGDVRGPEVDRLVERITLTRPHLVLVSMATPKQELFCQYAASVSHASVWMSAGAALESLLETGRPGSPWKALARRGLRGCWDLLAAPVRKLHRKVAFFRILRRTARPTLPALPANVER